MRIINFAVNNFRGISGGIEQNKIDFNDINTIFIFGQNNTGKSTFLVAYEYFYHDTNPVLDDFHRKSSENIIEIEIEVELDEWDRNRIENNAPRAKESYKAYLNHNNRIQLRTEWRWDGKESKSIKYTWDPEKSEFAEIGYASIGLHGVFQSCMPKPITIKAMPSEEEAKSILNSILKAIAEDKLKETELRELIDARGKIKELQEKMYKQEVIDSYQASVNKYMEVLFPDIKVDIADKKDRVVLSENKLGKEFDISFHKVTESGEIDTELPDQAGLIGHGTIRTAIFTLLLMRDIAEEFERIEGRKDYLVLFEEPELFLYPKVIRDLRDLIYTVSKGETPYQILCASHSPSMIDISKLKSSIVRLVKEGETTKLYQVSDSFLRSASGSNSDEMFKQDMYEILRFNPFICEAFYADEVILVEGPTEEIVLRAFLQTDPQDKFFFILNCGTVNNIPFYQKVLSQFSIPYSIICDTDTSNIEGYDVNANPIFKTGIQKSISEQFQSDITKGCAGIFRCHDDTFEPAHRADSIPENLRMQNSSSYGKPFDANMYWKKVLYPNLDSPDIDKVPIISFMKQITGNNT
ncbi:ATP-dependent endonuclease [Candidatus Neomarinimicrobiota bacterium]